MGKTALIVDDSRTARVVLQKMLETHDLEVDTEESAEGALNYLSEKRPDIIFMDHMMPGMDGFEAVSAIKNNPATATIPIMMYTAQAGKVYVGQARALGAVGVLPKKVEPVEVSKVLENLRIIDGGTEQGVRAEGSEPTDADAGDPRLETFDRNLRILIQDLLDQQRAMIRRDLLDSHKTIAARVADEIAPPESDGGRTRRAAPISHIPNPAQVMVTVLAVIALVFAWLYWHSEQRWQEIQQQNVSLQRSLGEQQALERADAFRNQRQLDDYQEALDAAYAVALDSIEWAANQSSPYGFDELPMGDFRLSLISELAGHLAALDFHGLVRIESHVGNFCMTFSGPDGYALAVSDLPAFQCDRIGFEPDEAYELGLRQSVAFANFINLADERTGGRIRYEIISFGNSSPLLDYPSTTAGVSASSWNEIAARNNRVGVSLYPDAR
ncbi:MAG: response regulator [Gammaproteobacteria bacterium]|nr:response regulator [Gammaproteobacteria bacterium]MDH3428392.1 response regulator [Gammaproteobacteria bacterium]MDH3434771.1 response regulator [Gammaproteobacteria bacterium]